MDSKLRTWIFAVFYIAILRADFVYTTTRLTTQTLNGSSTDVSYQNVIHLYDDILLGYDKRIRPVRNQSQAVIVNFTFLLSNVIQFDTATQKLSFSGTFFFMWKDELLTWNSTKYGGLKEAKLPLKVVWTPTMVISKSLEGQGLIGHPTDIVTYMDDGYALWAPEGLFDIICEVNTKFYPFDMQTCKITIYVSDTYYKDVKLVKSSNVTESDLYYLNMEWNLVDTHTEEAFYLGVKFVNIVLRLKRRKAYLMYTVISPLVLLSVLNVGVFIVPVDTGEKGSIAITIFLSYGVFISTINDDLPHNSIDASYLLNYILLLLILSVTTVIYSFIQSWVFTYHADEEVQIKLLRTFFKTPASDRHVNNNLHVDENNVPEVETDKSRQTDTDILTWRKILRRIDITLFTVIFVWNAFATVGYMVYLAIGGCY